MGISGSVDSKSTPSKTRSPAVATSVDQPRQDSTLIVISPPTASVTPVSTPSSPHRDVTMPRNRSQSFDAAKTADDFDDDDVDDNKNSGSESIGFSLAELAHYCNKDHQRCSDEDKKNQSPGGKPTCESRDYDDVTTSSSAETREPSAETSSPSNAPLQVCGVKPPVVEQQAQKAAAADESTQTPSHSPVRPTKSDGSSDSQQPRQRVNSAAGTRSKKAPKLSEKHTRRSSEAITDITQAKKLSHRAVETQRQKKPDPTEAQRRRHNEQPASTTTPPPNGTTVKELPKRCPSAKSGVSATKSQQSTGPGKEEPEQPRPEMEVIVRSKPTTNTASPVGNVNQKSASTTSQKNVLQEAKPAEPVVSVNVTAAAAADDDDDDDDDDDWTNLITALRDPDDIRNRKSELRRGSGWNSRGQKIKSTKNDKQKTTEDDDDEEENEVNVFCDKLIHRTS